VQLSNELAHSQGADPDAEKVIVDLSSALFHTPNAENAIAQFRAVVRKIDPMLAIINSTSEILPTSRTSSQKPSQQRVPNTQKNKPTPAKQ
jgi:hypothetical protein